MSRDAADLPSLERAREYVHQRFRDRITMHDIASSAGIHPVHLGQSFRRQYGETVGNRRTAARALSGRDVVRI